MNNNKYRTIFAMVFIISIFSIYLYQTKVTAVEDISLINYHESENSSVEVKLCKDNGNNDSLIDETGLVPDRIIIPKVNIDLQVVSVPLSNGTWYVNDKMANYAEGSSLISTKPSNIGIYGHDNNFVFRPIKDLQTNDEIILYSGKFKARYHLINSFVTNSDNVDVFGYNADDHSLLTLVTCDGIFSEKRFIVQAKLDLIEETDCNEK